MTDSKFLPTGASVTAYLAAKANDQQSADCKRLMALLKKVTKKPPKMWGPVIVGYGAYHYTYPSGRSGDAPLTGFGIRGSGLVVYLLGHSKAQKALLKKLGKHKMTKACLYFKRLDDLDTKVLEKLVAGSIAELKRLYG